MRRFHLLAVVAALTWPLAGHGQVAAPSMLDEEPANQEPAPATQEAAPAQDARAQDARAPAPPAAARAAPTAVTPSAPSVVSDTDVDAEPEKPAPPMPEPPPPAAPAPGAAPAPQPAAAALRAIEPVRARFEDVLAAWRQRRDALREQNLARAAEAGKRLLDLQRELGIENLEDLAAAEVRASARALDAHADADALAHAQLAVQLAPDLALARLAEARALLARDPTQLGAIAAALAAAGSAVWREPHTRRALLGDLCAAGLAAIFATAALLVTVLFLRRVRILLHDAHHLPLLRLANPVQAGFLVLFVLAMPFALRLGPAALLALFALAAAPYLARGERIVLTVALAATAAIPWGAQRAAALAAWTGTLAEDVYVLEHGGDDGRVAARVEARAGELPAPALLALGRFHKRRGDLKGALRWYEAAGGRADATVNAGNVRFLLGDLDGAKAAYLSTVDRAGRDTASLAAAHYGLSRLFIRAAALDQAQEARRKAALADPGLLERYAVEDDYRANRWLIDVPVPQVEIAALADDDAPRAVAEAVQARLGGAVPGVIAPWLLLLAALALWPAALLGRRCSRACDRCGGAACVRCGPATEQLCGQCVNVFTRRVLVDARDRLRKQAQVRRHAVTRRVVARALAVVTGGAGHVWNGQPARGAAALGAVAFLAAAAVFWRGAVPPPFASRWDAALKLGAAVPLALLVWWLTVRDLFRRTRG